MFRKRLPLTATLITAVFFSPIVPANSATIAGTKCTKLNSTKIASNIKYTCVKSGKKLVWNKGVVIQDSSGAKPTPTSSTGPNPLPTPIFTPTPTPTPTPTQTQKVLTPAEILKNRITEELNSELPSVDLNNVPVNKIGNFHVDPKLPKIYTDSAELTLKKVAAAWEILRITNPPTIFVSDSIDWLIEASESKRKACAYNGDTSGMNQWMRSQTSRPYNWAVAYCLETTPIQIVPVDPGVNNGELPEHKVLSATGSDLGYKAIGAGDLTKQLPIWFIRGLKQVVSEYLDSVGTQQWAVTNWKAPSCSGKHLSDFNYSYEDTRDWCATFIGLQVSRYMVAEYGLKETLRFSIEANAMGKADFQKFLGVPLETFEKRAWEYLDAIGAFKW